MRALPVTTLACLVVPAACGRGGNAGSARPPGHASLVYYETYDPRSLDPALSTDVPTGEMVARSEEHTSELQSQSNLVCRLLLEKKKRQKPDQHTARTNEQGVFALMNA